MNIMDNFSIEYCNYEMIVIKNSTYKIGDIFYTNDKYWRYRKFNGLEIKNIDYDGFGCMRLHFDYIDWQMNCRK